MVKRMGQLFNSLFNYNNCCQLLRLPLLALFGDGSSGNFVSGLDLTLVHLVKLAGSDLVGFVQFGFLLCLLQRQIKCLVR